MIEYTIKMNEKRKEERSMCFYQVKLLLNNKKISDAD